MDKGSKAHTCGICSFTSKGLVLGLLSGLTFSWTTLIVKNLKNIYPGLLTAYRYLATSSFILPHLVLSQENPFSPPGYRLSILILAVSSAGQNFLIFIASRYLPLGESSALSSSNPVFITLAGRVFLKESLGLVQVVALLATIIGIVLITGVHNTMTQNSRIYTTENLYGLAAALGSLIFATIVMILMRRLGSKNIHHSVIVFVTGVVGVIVSVILTSFLGNFNFCYSSLEKGLIILLGVLSCLAFLTLTVAARYAEAGPVSTMRAASDIFFSFLWQVIMFGDIPDFTTVCGAILVSIAIVLVGFSQKINAFLPEKCKKFC